MCDKSIKMQQKGAKTTTVKFQKQEAGEDIKDLADLRKLNSKPVVGKDNKQSNLDCRIFKSLDSGSTKLVQKQGEGEKDKIHRTGGQFVLKKVL